MAAPSSLQVVTETNVTSRSPTFVRNSVPVPSYQSGGSPPQPHRRTIPSFDDRIFDAAFQNVNGVDHLVAAHQVQGPSGSVPVVARWYDINTANGMSLIQSGNAPAGASGSSQFMPSVNINTAGSIGMTFDESSSSEFWSMYVTEPTASDPAGTMEAPVLAKAGTAVSSDSRVGDFSSTAVDPSDGTTFWSANEYQGSQLWDTHIARLQYRRCSSRDTHDGPARCPMPSRHRTRARQRPWTPARERLQCLDQSASWLAGRRRQCRTVSAATTIAVGSFWAGSANCDSLNSAIVRGIYPLAGRSRPPCRTPQRLGVTSRRNGPHSRSRLQVRILEHHDDSPRRRIQSRPGGQRPSVRLGQSHAWPGDTIWPSSARARRGWSRRPSRPGSGPGSPWSRST